MPKNRVLSLAIATFVMTFCSLANAGLLEFDSGVSITDTNKWTAGSDSTGQWYGSDFTINDGSAILTESSNGNSRRVANSVNSVMIAFELDDSMVGSHSWSIDTLYNNYNNQYNYGQVYLLTDNQNVMLNQGIWGKKNGYSTIISQEYPSAGTGNMTWDTFGSSFDLSESQTQNYSYIAFVFTGSKYSDQTLAFDNFSTTLMDASKCAIPEPATVAIAGLGALIMFRKKKTT